MHFCTPHWQALRNGVAVRGMSHLVAKSGHEAQAALRRQLAGHGKPEDWDPLMQAYLAITHAVMEQAGLQVLADDYCPLCAVQASYDEASTLPELPDARIVPAEVWIDSCLDAMHRYARENGLVPGVQ